MGCCACSVVHTCIDSKAPFIYFISSFSLVLVLVWPGLLSSSPLKEKRSSFCCVGHVLEAEQYAMYLRIGLLSNSMFGAG